MVLLPCSVWPWTIAGLPLPAPMVAYMNIFAGALHPVRALANRAWPVGGRSALQPRSVRRPGGREVVIMPLVV